MSEFNRMQTIKRHMFALRNGIIADSLRKAGAGYNLIFGLNLPQIQEIADSLPRQSDLAEELWSDTRTRESLLLAPMVYPAEEMDIRTAMRWIDGVRHIEVADILCHRLLRRLPFAWDLAQEIAPDDNDMHRYIAMRLMWNLLSTHRADILPYAESEAARGCRLTSHIASSLVDEIKFLNDEGD